MSIKTGSKFFVAERVREFFVQRALQKGYSLKISKDGY